MVTEVHINQKGVPIEEIKIGYTYRVNDPNSWLHEQTGKCCVIFPTRGEHGVVALYIGGKAHNVFPCDLTLVSKTA